MIAGSDFIQEKAERFRGKITETEALVAECMVRGADWDEVVNLTGCDREEYERISRRPLVNIYFFMLLALVNTKEGEIYEQAVDELEAKLAEQSKMIDTLRGEATFH